jgi:hypothetical protein
MLNDECRMQNENSQCTIHNAQLKVMGKEW